VTVERKEAAGAAGSLDISSATALWAGLVAAIVIAILSFAYAAVLSRKILKRIEGAPARRPTREQEPEPDEEPEKDEVEELDDESTRLPPEEESTDFEELHDDKKIEEAPPPPKPVARVRCSGCNYKIPMMSMEETTLECPECGKKGKVRIKPKK
jgi:hypothetical protein